MKSINSLMIIWIIIHALFTIISSLSSEPEITFIFYFSIISFALNCLGLLLILINKLKAGSILFFIGSIVFVPIGLIGVLGARKLLNEIKKEEFLKTL